jgi:hypothetical protein
LPFVSCITASELTSSKRLIFVEFREKSCRSASPMNVAGKLVLKSKDCRKKLRAYSKYPKISEPRFWLLLFIIHHKTAEGTVVGAFAFLGKETAGDLLHFPMIGDALTTFAFFLTIICACTICFILFYCTFHISKSLRRTVKCMCLLPIAYSPSPSFRLSTYSTHPV